ncbi:MAG: MarR family transcriptional regulator, partial [Oceanospirillaceae bacterium]|nr:MarR family transcriptional regulator [Oceanospirillaceae bacterium]
MKAKQQKDAVDLILDQWERERPDLDVTPMGTLGRLKRSAALLQRRLDLVFAEFGMTLWEFDVLATLRRSGAPYCLAPTELFSTLMITSGTMTHRLKSLESSGLVERLANPDDARSKLVQLTGKGLELIDRTVEAHVDNIHSILAPLETIDLEALDQGLVAMLAMLE